MKEIAVFKVTSNFKNSKMKHPDRIFAHTYAKTNEHVTQMHRNTTNDYTSRPTKPNIQHPVNHMSVCCKFICLFGNIPQQGQVYSRQKTRVDEGDKEEKDKNRKPVTSNILVICLTSNEYNRNEY